MVTARVWARGMAVYGGRGLWGLCLDPGLPQASPEPLKVHEEKESGAPTKQGQMFS